MHKVPVLQLTLILYLLHHAALTSIDTDWEVAPIELDCLL